GGAGAELSGTNHHAPLPSAPPAISTAAALSRAIRRGRGARSTCCTRRPSPAPLRRDRTRPARRPCDGAARCGVMGAGSGRGEGATCSQPSNGSANGTSGSGPAAPSGAVAHDGTVPPGCPGIPPPTGPPAYGDGSYPVVGSAGEDVP